MRCGPHTAENVATGIATVGAGIAGSSLPCVISVGSAIQSAGTFAGGHIVTVAVHCRCRTFCGCCWCRSRRRLGSQQNYQVIRKFQIKHRPKQTPNDICLLFACNYSTTAQ